MYHELLIPLFPQPTEITSACRVCNTFNGFVCGTVVTQAVAIACIVLEYRTTYFTDIVLE